MTNTNQGKSSLQEIYDDFLKEVPLSQQDYVQEYGFVLTISLSGAEQKANKKGNHVLAINDGCIVRLTSDEPGPIIVPYLISRKGFGLQKNKEGKVQLIEFDDYSRNVDDKKLKERLKGIPINWKIALSHQFLEVLTGSRRGWNKFTKLLSDHYQVQLQMLVVKPVDIQEGAGKLETAKFNTKEVYTIHIAKSDILTAKLVVPGDGYIDKVDKPKIVMKPLKGRVVEENEPITVVTLGEVLEKQLNKNYDSFIALNSNQHEDKSTYDDDELDEFNGM